MIEKTNYGNWVPEKMLYLMFGLTAVFLVIAVAAKAVLCLLYTSDAADDLVSV